MALDQIQNFVRGELSESIDSEQTSIDVEDGSIFPSPPAEYNLVIYDAGNFSRASKDPNVEIVRVTDVTDNTLTVERGQENTDASSHPGSAEAFLSITSKMFTDIDQRFDEVGGGEPIGLDSDEFDEFLQDQESANEMASAPVTMGAVVASLPAMDAVSTSETAMDAVSNSQTARDAIGTDGVAYNSIAVVSMAIGKYAAGLAGLDATDYADINAVTTDQTAMDAVAASQKAMDAVSKSILAITAFFKSQHLMDVVYSSEENTNNLLSRPTTFSPEFTPTEYDWTETSNGWDGPDGGIEVRYGSNLSDSEGWGSNGGFDDTPSEAESVIGFSPQGSEQGRRTLGFDVDLTEVDELDFIYMHQNGFSSRPQEIIIDDDVVFNNEGDQDWTDASVDLSTYSGEVTFEFGFGDDLDHDDADRWCGFTAFEFN